MRNPSPAELAILERLRQRGPSTVRELHTAMAAGTAYTTVLKQLQVLHAKKLVTRNTSGRSHVYAAAVDPDAARRSLLEDFVERVFGGSARDLILGALGSEEISDDDRKEIRRILED